MQKIGERISVKAAGRPRAAQIIDDETEAEQPRQAAITHQTDDIWWNCSLYRK